MNKVRKIIKKAYKKLIADRKTNYKNMVKKFGYVMAKYVFRIKL